MDPKLSRLQSIAKTHHASKIPMPDKPSSWLNGPTPNSVLASSPTLPNTIDIFNRSASPVSSTHRQASNLASAEHSPRSIESSEKVPLVTKAQQVRLIKVNKPKIVNARSPKQTQYNPAVSNHRRRSDSAPAKPGSSLRDVESLEDLLISSERMQEPAPRKKNLKDLFGEKDIPISSTDLELKLGVGLNSVPTSRAHHTDNDGHIDPLGKSNYGNNNNSIPNSPSSKNSKPESSDVLNADAYVVKPKDSDKAQVVLGINNNEHPNPGFKPHASTRKIDNDSLPASPIETRRRSNTLPSNTGLQEQHNPKNPQELKVAAILGKNTRTYNTVNPETGKLYAGEDNTNDAPEIKGSGFKLDFDNESMIRKAGLAPPAISDTKLTGHIQSGEDKIPSDFEKARENKRNLRKKLVEALGAKPNAKTKELINIRSDDLNIKAFQTELQKAKEEETQANKIGEMEKFKREDPGIGKYIYYN